MLTPERIAPLIQREVDRIAAAHPEHGAQVRSLAAEFRARFQENLETPQDALELCRRIDSMLGEHEIPPELLTEIQSSRRQILYDILQEGLTGSLTGDYPVRLQLQFPPRAAGRRGNGSSPSRPGRTDSNLEEIIRNQNFDLLRLATSLGADAAADVLCALDQVGEEDRSRVISFISAYLGRSPRPTGSGPEILTYPRQVLEVPAVRSVARRHLLLDTYDHLLSRGADDPEHSAEIRRRVSGVALERMRTHAREAGVTDPTIHAGLFVDLGNFFQRACSQPHPETLISSIREQERDCPFPSLRQALAMQANRERRKLYVGFEPGFGKTPIPIIMMEQDRIEGKNPRMLYLAPKMVLQELPNRLRPGSAPQPTRDCYYRDPDRSPDLGIVEGGMRISDLRHIVENPRVVFCPYSILHSERDLGDQEDSELRLIDLLCAQRWDYLVIDEAQYVDGNGVWTRLLDRIIHGENGRGTYLTRNGLIVALSGTPYVNTVADPVVVHDLFLTPEERQARYGTDLRDTQGRQVSVERGLGPLRVRQALSDTLFMLDKPQPWLHRVEVLDYELSDREARFVRAICSNPSLHAKTKIDATNQFILCPKLVSGDETMPESLLEWVGMQLEHDLQERNSVLIVENMRAQGVLRAATGDDAPDMSEMELHFYRQIERMCQEWSRRRRIPVRFSTIHGKTPPEERQQSYATAAEAQSRGECKSVILAMASCLNTGIRLHVDRIISNEWPYNSPELQQLLKRALREGFTDVFLTACYARGTVQQGTYDQAMDKYRDILEAGHGISASDAMLRAHLRAREQEDAQPETAEDLFRIFRRSSPQERRYELARWLHGRGMNGVRQFWDRWRDLFDEFHAEDDELGTGDMQRFLGALIHNLAEYGGADAPAILDVNSGGLTLERELRRLGCQARTTSADPHSVMLERGRAALFRDDQNRIDTPSTFEASAVDIHRILQEEEHHGRQFDIVVLRNLEQCHHIQSEQVVHERARALLNTLRTLRIGGRIVIPFPRIACTNEEFGVFVTETLELFGCRPVAGWHGAVRSRDNENDQPFRGFCVIAEKTEDVDEPTLRELLRPQDLHFSHHADWPASAEATRVRNAMREPRLPYPLRHREFELGNHRLSAADVRADVRATQVEHLRKLEEAVAAVRALAPTAREWSELTGTQRRPLRNRGILYSAELSRTVNRPTCSLRDYPGHLFFPYDSQWAE